MDYRIRAGRRTVVVSENALDRAIRWASPELARRRMSARLQLEAAASWSGGSRSKRSLSDWKPGGGSADADLLPELADLRERSRDLVRNEPLAAGAINTVCTNVVGTGLMPKFQPRRDILGWTEERAAEWSRTVAQEFALWAESTDCDATRTQTFYGLQDLVLRSRLENGDVFALLPMVGRPGVAYRLAVQLIEADRVCNRNRATDAPRLAGGVEMDQWGAPLRYHILRGHPGDMRAAREWDIVEAFGAESGRRNVLHVFSKRRIGQTRGAPYLAPVIEHLKQLSRYSEAEVFAAVANAMFAIKVTTPDKTGLSPLESATTGQTPAAGVGGDARDSNWNGTLTPGLVVDLGEGEDIGSVNTDRPNAGYGEFVMAFCRPIGVALELPYEVLVKHFTASYSAARAALLEAWKTYRKERYHLAEVFCQPVTEEWMAEGVARGRIDAPGFFADPMLRFAYTYATWHGDGPGALDPLKEILATQKRLEIQLTTLDQEKAEYDGGDAASSIEQAGREKKLREKAGLPQPGADPALPLPAPEPNPDLPEDVRVVV